jgi:hypothetical protein
MLVVAVVILAGVVVVASGRGGEIVATSPDYPPIDLGPVSAADVALLRPPSAAWGYNMRVTDEALEVIAKAVTERDVEIAALQQEVSDLRDQLGGGGRPTTLEPAGDGGGAGRAEPEAPAAPEAPEVPEPAWPSDAEAAAGGAAVPITRPQPIYHDPGGYGDKSGQSADEVQFGRRDWSDGEGAADQSVQGGQSVQSDQSDQSDQSGQGDQSGHSGESGHGAGSSQRTQGEPASGWSAAPADTSPDATALDWSTVPAPGGTALPAPAPAPDPWDKDPHQQLVWGAADARAKSARAAEETQPSGERRDDDRG